jgi:F1F0 ATPase subunit 2
MDEQAVMTGRAILALLPWFAVGLAAGSAHVAALWPNVRWLTAPDRRGMALAALAGRFLALAALLGFAAWMGQGPFLAMALGVLLARPIALRIVRRRIAPPAGEAGSKGLSA